MRYLDIIQENVHGHRKKLLFFIERIELFRTKKSLPPSAIEILDIGCGNGTAVTLPIGELGYSITGIDIHEPSIEYAKNINRLKNARFLLQDIGNLLQERKFDIIICSDVLEHLDEPKKLLLQIKSVVKENGIILISIPNGFGPFEIENYLFGIWPFKLIITAILSIVRFRKKEDKSEKIVPYHHECGHIQFFTMSRFKRLIRSSGYRIAIFKKSLFLGGILTYMILSKIPSLMRFNIRLGEYIPSFMCSVWYFECKPE